MTAIRPYRSADLGALYDICLKTGDSGQDATHLHADPKVVGHIYAGPYGVLSPETALVAEDGEGVGGYVVGALDTAAFEERLERDWWPTLRQFYREPDFEQRREWGLDETRAWLIHHPFRTPAALAGDYPSHLHINLLPRLQGTGLGKALIDQWIELVRGLGSRGLHFGVSAQNERALRFYRTYGFDEFTPDPPTRGGHWFVMKL